MEVAVRCLRTAIHTAFANLDSPAKTAILVSNTKLTIFRQIGICIDSYI